MTIEQAVILAGGLGTRLGELTKHTPKPLLDVAGQPFLAYLIENLRRHGIQDIILSTGYRSEIAQKLLADGSELGVKIRYSVEANPLGTGGGLRNCLNLLNPEFLVINGDTLFDIDYHRLVPLLTQSEIRANGVIALRKVDDISRYGSVMLDGTRVVRFNEKGFTGPGLISGGVYLLRRDVISGLPGETKLSLETDLFPALVTAGTLYGVSFDGYFLDIGLPETLNRAQIELPAWQQGLPVL